jgi:3'-5' exonuclease
VSQQGAHHHTGPTPAIGSEDFRGRVVNGVSWRIFIDIETLPPDRGTSTLPDAYASCTEEEYRGLALGGESGRLLCVGVVAEKDGAVVNRGLFGRERDSMSFHLDEARTLRGFWNYMRRFDAGRDLLVGFNVLDFDLRFLWQRSVVHGVRPTVNLNLPRYRQAPVYDVMWEFGRWQRRLSLHELACALGLDSSKREGIDGSKIYDLYLQGRHRDIADYCLRDVELTRQAYYRLTFETPPNADRAVAHRAEMIVGAPGAPDGTAAVRRSAV